MNKKKKMMAHHHLFVAIVIVMIAALVGCDSTMGAGPSTKDYIGSYGSTAGRTVVNLEITADAMTSVAFTESGDSERSRLTAASARSENAESAEDAVWVIFTGDITVAGSNVTVTITGVERDGQKLEGAELAAYTSCAITATTGDAFDDEVMAGVMKCLGRTEPVTLHRQQRPSILGNWQATDSDRPTHIEKYVVEISSTRITTSMIHTTACIDVPSPDCDIPIRSEWNFDIEEIGDTTIEVVFQEIRIDPDHFGQAAQMNDALRGSRITNYYVFSSDRRLSFLDGSGASTSLWLSKRPE